MHKTMKIEPRRYGELTTFDTRAAANETVDRQTRYKQIIEILGDRGLTAKEIAYILYHKKAIPSPERNFTAPRLTELSNKGVVEVIGKKTCAWTGRKVAVYKLRENYDKRR